MTGTFLSFGSDAMASSSSKPFMPGIERSITMAPGRLRPRGREALFAVERATHGEPDARRRPGDQVDRIGIVVDHEDLAGYRRVVDLQSVKQPLLGQRLGEMLARARHQPAPPVVVDRGEDHRNLVEREDRRASWLSTSQPEPSLSCRSSRIRSGRALLRECYAVRGRVGDDDLVVRLLQPALDQLRGRSIVFDHKRSLPALADTRLCRCATVRSRPAPPATPASSRGTVSVNVDPSPTTLRHRDIAAHQPHEPPGDREAKPAAAIPARGRRVGLRRRSRTAVRARPRVIPMPVSATSNTTISPCGRCSIRTAERDRTPFGELHRIAEEVQQALPKLGRVARKPPGIFRHIDLERHIRRLAKVRAPPSSR